MINLLSALTLSVIGSMLIIRHDNNRKKKSLDFIMILAVWSLILSGAELMTWLK